MRFAISRFNEWVTHTSGSAPPEPGRARRRGISATVILGVVVPVMVIVLAAQNTATVRFRFLWWHVRSPLVVIILGSALAGVVLEKLGELLWRARSPHRGHPTGGR
jgi:uncharacterized integral membrane protein